MQQKPTRQNRVRIESRENMNAFEKFLSERPFGFVTVADMPELIQLHRLCQCLVRCGSRRFICAAQDVAGMIRAVEKDGDYVRDVAITSTEIEAAPRWVREVVRVNIRHAMNAQTEAVSLAGRAPSGPWCGEIHFDESECGGAFDGTQVSSDADSGL